MSKDILWGCLAFIVLLGIMAGIVGFLNYTYDRDCTNWGNELGVTTTRLANFGCVVKVDGKYIPLNVYQYQIGLTTTP